MYLVYIDESGDTGLPSAHKSSEFYTLSALIIRDVDWLTTLNQFIEFRGFLFKNFGIKQSAELKASYLIHGNGTLKSLALPESSRMKIFKMALKLQAKIGTIKTWALVYDKVKWQNKGWHKPILEASWQNMIERLERFTATMNEPCMVFPDEGNEKYVTGILRRMRRFSRPNARFQSATPLDRNATMIIEDPNFRHSKDSYFVQFADLNAYVASRHVFPNKWMGQEYWDYLGDSRYASVNRVAGGPPGIAIKP